MSNIKSITPIGTHQTYDLEVHHPDHQFYLANGVLTSNSHAVAYAIDSFHTAFLMTYHQQEWLCAYLEAMSVNDLKRAKAFAEVRSIGYDIVPIDVKYATTSWTIVDGKKLMPSLTSCKGVGVAAAEELDTLRPFDTIEDMLWTDEGKWRLSKFNKKAFEGLIKVGAFETFDCVGEGKLFNNYQHMHAVVIDNISEIKKSTKKEPFKGKTMFYDLINQFDGVFAPYTKQENIEHFLKYYGTIDVNTIISHQAQEKLADRGIKSVDEYSTKDLYWFCVVSATPRTSKNNRKYLMLEISGPAGGTSKMFMWSWDGVLKIEPYSIFIGEISKSDFGFATSQRKLRLLNV